jgi:DNA-binding winged helix-turn-helix (wHTH) protein/TolB-like protein/Tfp pilus assembly protein PilF
MNIDEPQTTVYEFDEFRIDTAKRLLLKRTGEAVPLMPKAFETLLHLVKNSGKVLAKEELIEAIWSETIVEDNNLTQNISILRRVFGEKPGEHRFIATVPGKGYKFVPEVRESAREKAKEPAAAEPDSGFVANPKPETRNRAARRFAFILPAILGILVLGAIGFYLRRESGKSADVSIRSIAVLPFKPLVAENRNEALELGMADTLISKLAGDEIVVRPLNAVRRYNSLEQDSLAAGRELGTEAVLDGTIQTAGERIRVSARLFRIADGKQLWSGQFDEKLTGIFEVQDSISGRVASALKIQLGNRGKKRSTANVEAYQLYMKGRFHALRLTRAETDKAIEYFHKTIEIDPNYALAYVGLAEAYLPMALTSGRPSREVLPQAKAAAQKAVELDETLPEAHAALGLVIFWFDWDWRAAESQYLRALELNPHSPEARFGYAHLLSNTLRHEEAMAEIRRALELDPLTLRNNAVEGQILFFAGKHERALDRLQNALELEPNFWLAQLFISRVYSEMGKHAEAVEAAKKAGAISGNSQSIAYRAYALAKAGKAAEARLLLDELAKLSASGYVPPYNIALVYNGLGEEQKALDYLEKGFAERDGRMIFLAVEPMWNNLRGEPRFTDLLRRMNFE